MVPFGADALGGESFCQSSEEKLRCLDAGAGTEFRPSAAFDEMECSIFLCPDGYESPRRLCGWSIKRACSVWKLWYGWLAIACPKGLVFWLSTVLSSSYEAGGTLGNTALVP